MADIWVQVGEDLLVDILDGGVPVPSDWFVGWGTGAGTADKSDTALFTEAPETRIAATLSQPSSDQSRYVALLAASAGRTITNAGVFSLVSGGVLWVHSDFSGVVLASGDRIEFTFTITWS